MFYNTHIHECLSIKTLNKVNVVTDKGSSGNLRLALNDCGS